MGELKKLAPGFADEVGHTSRAKLSQVGFIWWARGFRGFQSLRPQGCQAAGSPRRCFRAGGGNRRLRTPVALFCSRAAPGGVSHLQI